LRDSEKENFKVRLRVDTDLKKFSFSD